MKARTAIRLRLSAGLVLELIGITLVIFVLFTIRHHPAVPTLAALLLTGAALAIIGSTMSQGEGRGRPQH